MTFSDVSISNISIREPALQQTGYHLRGQIICAIVALWLECSRRGEMLNVISNTRFIFESCNLVCH